MAFATFSIGILPTYEQIGILAPVFLIFCRLLQSLSMTSEEVGAALYLMENAPLAQKGYASSLVLGTAFLGLALGSIISTILFTLFDQQTMQTWGWRIPFIVGGVFGFIVLIIRIQQPESFEFQHAAAEGKLTLHPFTSLVKTHFRQLICSTALFSLLAVSIYLYAVYFPNTIWNATFDKRYTMLICSFGFIITFIVSFITGKLIDRISIKLPMIFSSSGFIILSYPLFTLLMSQSVVFFMLAYMTYGILLGIAAGATMFTAVQPFPIHIRFSGSCIAFNLCMSLLGSFTPLAALYLVHLTASQNAPVLLLISAGLLTLSATLFSPKDTRISTHDYQTCRQNG